MQYKQNDLKDNFIYMLEKHKDYIAQQYSPKEELLKKYDQWIDNIKNLKTLDWNKFQKFILSLTEFSENSLGLIRSQYADIIIEIASFMKNINISELKESQQLEITISNMTDVNHSLNGPTCHSFNGAT